MRVVKKNLFLLFVLGLCALAWPNRLPGQQSTNPSTHWDSLTVAIKTLQDQFSTTSDYFEVQLPSENYLPKDLLEAKSLGNFYLNLGYAYENYDRNYYRAIELYKSGKLLHESQLDTVEFESWAFAVHSIANIYTRFGDYVRSAHLFQILHDERLKRNENDPYLEGLQLDLALALHSGGRPDEAINIIKTEKFSRPETTNYSTLLLAEIIQSKQSKSEMDYLLSKIHKQLRNLPDIYMRPSKEERWSHYFQLKSNWELDQNRIEDALTSINNAIDTSQEKSGRSLSWMLISKARLLLTSGQIDSALINLDESMRSLGFKIEPVSKEPPIQLENNLVENYKMRGDIYSHIYQKTKDHNYLDTSLFWYNKSVEVDFFIRDQLIFKNSKTKINTSNKDICETGIKSCIHGFLTSKNPKFLERAFDFSEYNKAANLRDHTAKITRKNHVELDSQRKEQLSLLKSQLEMLYRENRLKRTIDNEHSNLQKTQISSLELKIRELESNQILFIRNSNRNSFTTFPVSKIQDLLLLEKSVMMSYFVGSDAIYRFILDGNSIILDTFKLDKKLKKRINQLVALSSTPWNLQSQWNDFKKISAEIQDIFYTPKVKAKHVHYSLDDFLHTLSIASLYIQKSLPNKKSEYLINKYSISYQYSPSIWFQSESSEEKEIVINNSLLIAPQKYLSDEIADLPFDTTLFFSSISSNNIDYLHRRNASFDSIQNCLSRYDILHFHTHGSSRPYSMLECYDQPLFVDEVEQSSLKARLVVLSACQTGLGQRISTEGPLSMARGFAMAGVPTTVMTHWKVNNSSTQIILSDFYKNLSPGMSSTEALRNAQLNYISNHSGFLSSPYYWSGISHSGKSIQLSNRGRLSKYSGPFLVIVSLLLFLYYFKRT